ncbi:predicted protein [Sclerotinia sclerotiorum 1980 UF-70]|uniref:Uncharacterized protein n=1 Tax=Sclerotinia sclerotiorum (strain ATCC 18683 / 1980 / Ss-1) TaxID=665079 RepID=A7F3L5_SCLS1|nr:predicted protein [Sclerotinia sclerotiorum 1980 UF-70]EDN97336.1 predicted protein [Sclerotinia sclerotiorum 1980 UF-70]
MNSITLPNHLTNLDFAGNGSIDECKILFLIRKRDLKEDDALMEETLLVRDLGDGGIHSRMIGSVV